MEDPIPTVPGSPEPQKPIEQQHQPASVQNNAVDQTVPTGQIASVDQTVPAENNTDVMGIISIVLAFIGMQLPGLVVGIIGSSKAKKEGRSTTLSTVGIVLNAVFMVIVVVIVFVLVLGSFRAAQDTAKLTESLTNYSSTDSGGSSSDSEFLLATEYQLADVCEGKGWPSNAVSSDGTHSIYSVMTDSSIYPGSYSTSSFVSLSDDYGYDSDNATVVDRVICMTTTGQSTISEVTCDLTVDDKPVVAMMSRKNYLATVYDVSSRKAIGTFEVEPTSDCPYYISVNEDYSFTAYPDGDNAKAKIIAFDAEI